MPAEGAEPAEPADLALAYDAEVGAWVASGTPPGPAGSALLAIEGVSLVVDFADPARLVEVVIDPSTTPSLLSALLSRPSPERLLDPAGGDVIDAALTPAARASLGWLAVALERGHEAEAVPSVWTAEALLLARRAGVDALLDEPLDLDEVAEWLDDLPSGLLGALDQADRGAADRLRAVAALVRSAGIAVREDVDGGGDGLDAGDVAARFADMVEPLAPAPALLGGPGGEVPVWCSALGAEAVDAARGTWDAETGAARAILTLGQVPPRSLWVQAVRGDDGAAVGPPVQAVWAGTDGELAAEVGGLDRSQTWALHVLAGPTSSAPPPLDVPPLGLVGRREAHWWGRSAVLHTWAGRPGPAARAWAESARWWEEVGDTARADAARSGSVRVASSPFLVHRPGLRSTLDRLPPEQAQAVAALCDALGWPAAAAEARARHARRLDGAGDERAAAIVGGLARGAYQRLAARRELRRLETLPGGQR